MKKAKWVKQLTRENSLLDRAFRVLAYSQSVKEVGKAAINKNPIIGFGRVTSFYYNPRHYKLQQKIILKEFRKERIESMGQAILSFLEQTYAFGKEQESKIRNRKDLINFIEQFMRHHAHGRGAIVYGYWGEPVITAKLKTALSRKIKKDKLDLILSSLSVPLSVNNRLKEIHVSSSELLAKKEDLIKKFNLKGKTLEYVRILSWFTLFYELGEKVSSFLFDELMRHLSKIVKNKKILEELEWYTPAELILYLKHGKKLSEREVGRRKQCYILESSGKTLRVTGGEEALKRYQNEFEEKIDLISVNKIKGTPASAGKARGKVKIVITGQDQNKMRKGDILVSTMTTPRLITAMKKAAAIVTDEGGLTAHAAIVSRELGIPCIVGAKIATRVLKDGDYVEVDADKGIVRKINK